MLGFGHKESEGAVSVYVYEGTSVVSTVETSDEEASQATEHHCAWCGDPPNEFGSHGICPFHAEQLIEQAAARRRKRGH